MDIDLSVLRLMEREREIPFDELVTIIEQAILTAYLKHTDSQTARTHRRPRGRAGSQDRPRLDLRRRARRGGRGHRRGGGHARATSAASRAFAAKQVINQRLRDIADDAVLGEFRGKRGRHRRRRHPAGPEPAHGARRPRHGRGDPAARGAGARRGVHARLAHPRLRHERRARAPRARRSPCRAPTPASSASCSPSRCPRSPAASSRSSRWPARPATAPRSPSGPTTRRSTPRAPASASSASACARSPRSCNGEKIDIVDYDRRPRDVRRERPVAGEGHIEPSSIDASLKAVRALVPDYQLSLAIGKEGQNARLAAKLTGARDRHPARLRSSKRAAQSGRTGRRRPSARGVTWIRYERASVADSVLPGPPC